MRFLISILAGALSATTAILLHQSIPPFGITLALCESALAIFAIGRMYGLRRYQIIAALTWFLVVYKAGTFGASQELLLQGDGVGTTLFLLGTFTVCAMTFKR